MPPRATPRVREHVDKLREAGLDTQKFFDVLVGIREDSGLPKLHREALYRLIATESFIWYLEAIRNEQIDRVKLREELRKLDEEFNAAIRTKSPGEIAQILAGSAPIGVAGAAGAGGATPTPAIGAPPPSEDPKPASKPALKIPQAETKRERTGPRPPAAAGAPLPPKKK